MEPTPCLEEFGKVTLLPGLGGSRSYKYFELLKTGFLFLNMTNLTNNGGEFID